MTEADLLEYVGYCLGCWGAGWCTAMFFTSIRRVISRATGGGE